MKAIKPLFLFTFSIVMLTGCFDSPEFSDTPSIEFVRIEFGLAPTPAKPDSLVVTLNFEDGDGDLGLTDDQKNFPFHERDFFLHNGSAITHTIRPVYNTVASTVAVLDIPNDVSGKLVRFGDPIAGLPEDNCDNYRVLNVYLAENDSHVFDETYTAEKMVIDNQNLWVVNGKFHVNNNRNDKNIFVEFERNLTPENPNTWEVYSWPGCDDFDGRFTILSDEPSPLSGTMRYTMSSFGIASVMGNPTTAWRLKFSILDQALRESNQVSTQPFILQEITK